jgi:hypothetical protein
MPNILDFGAFGSSDFWIMDAHSIPLLKRATMSTVEHASVTGVSDCFNSYNMPHLELRNTEVWCDQVTSSNGSQKPGLDESIIFS